MTKSKKRPVILKSTNEPEELTDNSLQPSQDQTSSVTSITENVDQPTTTNINMIVCEKKPRKSTKKTKMITPNSSGSVEATSNVSPLPEIETLPVGHTLPLQVASSAPPTAVLGRDCQSMTQTHSVAKLPSELVVEGLRPSDQTHSVAKLPSALVVEGLRPSDQISSNITEGNLESLEQNIVSPMRSASKKQTTKKPPTNKKPKRGKLNSTVQDNNKNELPPTLQIANIILHLKCSANDLEVYNEEVNRQLTDPMLYNPTVPPDIMTYQPAEQYSVLEETKPSNTQENYAYSESKNRIVSIGSNKFSEIETEVSNETTAKTEEDIDSTVMNMKEINTKLKKLKISLFKNMSFMDKKSACFWCTYDFDNPECYIPRYEMDGTVHGYGSFCRPECAAAYLMKENLDDSTKFERYHMLNQIYSKIYDYTKNIKPSPNPYYLLDKFYGNLTIQEYRKLLKSDHLLLVIDKPLTRILPELHEDNEEFLTSIYGNNTTITGGTNTQSTGATCAKSNTFGVYKVRRQSEKPVGVTKTSIIKEHFGITT